MGSSGSEDRMHPGYEAYFERLEALHADAKRAIAGLPQDALDWVAGPDVNPLGALVVHLTGAERYWIGDVVGGEPSGRDRAAEFEARGWDEAVLTLRLDETLAHCRAVLGGLTLEELAELRTSPRDGRQFSVAWSLAHALEHTALHLGHIQIVRQLWEQQGRGS